MNLKDAKAFYLNIKNVYNDDYESFFNYFEDTWFSLDDEKEERYNFSLWSYNGKFDIQKSRTQLISERKLDEYVFLSINACESLNHLINSLIAVNNNVSVITRNEIILKTLFIRMEVQKEQNNHHIERKQQLSDLLLELIKKGYGANKGLINENELKKLKNLKSEFDIFKLTFD